MRKIIIIDIYNKMEGSNRIDQNKNEKIFQRITK